MKSNRWFIAINPTGYPSCSCALFNDAEMGNNVALKAQSPRGHMQTE